MLVAILAAISTFPPPGPTAAPAPAPPPAAEAPATDPAAAAATAAAKPKEEPIVCKSQVVVGSRLPVKVCTRASDDATRKRSGRDSLDRLQLNNGIRPSPG